MPQQFGWALPPREIEELSMRDVRQIHNIFKQLDIDNNKSLSYEEAAAVMELVRDEVLTNDTFLQIDKNDTGYATYDEMLQFWFPRLRPQDIDRYLKLYLQPEEILQLCTVFNRLADVDGWLPMSSLVLTRPGPTQASNPSTVAGLLGLKLSVTSIRHLGSDKLSFREFLEVLFPAIPVALVNRYCSTTLPEEDFVAWRDIFGQLDKQRKGVLSRQAFQKIHLAAAAARVDYYHNSPTSFSNHATYPRIDDMDFDLPFFDYVDKYRTGKITLQQILQTIYPLIPKWEIRQIITNHDLHTFGKKETILSNLKQTKMDAATTAVVGNLNDSGSHWITPLKEELTTTGSGANEWHPLKKSPTSQPQPPRPPSGTYDGSRVAPGRTFAHSYASSSSPVKQDVQRGFPNREKYGKLPSLIPRSSTNTKTTQTAPTLGGHGSTSGMAMSPSKLPVRPSSSEMSQRFPSAFSVKGKPSTAGNSYKPMYNDSMSPSFSSSASPQAQTQSLSFSVAVPVLRKPPNNKRYVTDGQSPQQQQSQYDIFGDSNDKNPSNNDSSEYLEVVTITGDALADFLPQKVAELVQENESLYTQLDAMEAKKTAEIDRLKLRLQTLESQLEKVADIKDLIQDKVGVIQKKFTYQHDYDRRGLLYFIGTRGGIRGWANPATAGQVLIYGKLVDKVDVSPYVATPKLLTNGVSDGEGDCSDTNIKRGIMYTQEPVFLYPSSRSLIIDLGCSIDVSHYSLSSLTARQNKHGECYVVSWMIEGCKTGGKGDRTEIWDLLSQHTDDTTLCGPDVRHTWTLHSKGRAYRYIRLTVQKILQLTKPEKTMPDNVDPLQLLHAYNSAAAETWQTLLPVGGLELYGLCQDLPCQYFGIASAAPAEEQEDLSSPCD